MSKRKLMFALLLVLALSSCAPSVLVAPTCTPTLVAPGPPTLTPTVSPGVRQGASPVARPLVVTATPSPTSTSVPPTPETGGRTVTLTVVYDNNGYDARLRTAWGFACWVEYGDHTILFDTGGDAGTLLGNMEQLGLDPWRIEAVVLSHAHGDHTGGLAGLLASYHDFAVYVPRSFSSNFKQRVRAAGAELVEVGGPLEIMPGVYSTGELGDGIREQALVLESEKGLVVLTGCAHPGIVDILEHARAQRGGDIYLSLGGFHLGSASSSGIERIVSDFRRLGVQKVAPCHCSGDQARAMFAAEYGDDCLLAGVGWRVAIGADG